VVLLVSGARVSARFGARPPQAVIEVVKAVSAWRSVNSYGLFAVMTTSRREIVIEGSRDGQTWTPYRFRWKPNAPDERPRFATPHMPRLDWQMWFASLSTIERQAWMRGLLGRLLEGSPDVVGLFAEDPFAGTPPRFVRARVEDWRFSSWSDWRETGRWWVVAPAGMYAGPVGGP
jgi:hypothetical protein